MIDQQAISHLERMTKAAHYSSQKAKKSLILEGMIPGMIPSMILNMAALYFPGLGLKLEMTLRLLVGQEEEAVFTSTNMDPKTLQGIDWRYLPNLRNTKTLCQKIKK